MNYLRVSAMTPENEHEITDWKCVYYGGNLDDVEGYFLISVQSETSEFLKFKHVEILDEEGTQITYYFQHDWLPKNEWFRLWPVHEELKPYVTPKKIEKKEFDAKAYMAQVDAGNTFSVASEVAVDSAQAV